MSSLNLKMFARPETLRAIRPDLLLAWLAPATDYFSRRGVVLPRNREEKIPYDHLAGVFLAPTPDMPQALVDSLYLVHGLATPDGMDALREAATRNGLTLEAVDRATPADLAVQVVLLAPGLAQDTYNLEVVSHQREFRYFSAAPAPPFARPTAEHARRLEHRLDAYYRATHRGGGTRVFGYVNETEYLFLIRHGLPCRREETIEEDQTTTIFFRPCGHDTVIYSPATGQLRMHACGERERRVLLRAFGACLFGSAGHFQATPQYTLAPLAVRGRACLACADAPGLEKISLVGLEIFYPREKLTIKYACPDVFTLAGSRFHWPADLEQLKRARFKVHFAGVGRPRLFTIEPWNKIIFGRDSDSAILQHWVALRGFALVPPASAPRNHPAAFLRI